MRTGKALNQRAGNLEQLTSCMSASVPTVQLENNCNIVLTAECPQNQSVPVTLAPGLDSRQLHQPSLGSTEHSPALCNIQSPDSSDDSTFQIKHDNFNPLQYYQSSSVTAGHVPVLQQQWDMTQNYPQAFAVPTDDSANVESIVQLPVNFSFLDTQPNVQGNTSLDLDMINELLYKNETEPYPLTMDVGDGGEPPCPLLTFQHQPTDKFRFRYLSENGQHGYLTSKDSGGGNRLCPTVRVENMRGRVQVRVQLFTWDSDASKRTKHLLLRFKRSEIRVKTGEMLTLDDLTDELVYTMDSDKDQTCQLSDIIILRLIKTNLMDLGMTGSDSTKIGSEFSKKDVCLRVDVAVPDQGYISPPVFSTKIIDERTASSPKIKNLFLLAFDKSGGPQIILFTSKFKKGDIQVKVEDSTGNTYCCEILYLHNQSAIHCRMPSDIEDSNVSIFLYQPKDGELSNRLPLTNLPRTGKDSVKKRKHTGAYEEAMSVTPPVFQAGQPGYQHVENVTTRHILYPTRHQTSPQGQPSHTSNPHPTPLAQNDWPQNIPQYNQYSLNPRLMADEFIFPVRDPDREYDGRENRYLKSRRTSSESSNEVEDLEKDLQELSVNHEEEEKICSSAIGKREDKEHPPASTEKTPTDEGKKTVPEGNSNQNKPRKDQDDKEGGSNSRPSKEESPCNELNINDYDENGLTALHVSVMAGSEEGVRQLLEQGADVNLPCRANGDTALHMALRNGHTLIMALLIITGKVDVFIVNEAGDSVVDLVEHLPIDHPAHTIINDHLKDCDVKQSTESSWDSSSDQEEDS